jgi:homoserine O-acetyltransferase
MVSYRSYEGYGITQAEEAEDKFDSFKASSYQRYQGEKLANRFDAYSYITLSKAMDSQNVLRNRGTLDQITCNLNMPALVVGIDSDMLFPLSEQQLIAEKLPNAQLVVLSSEFGHDGFLVEFNALTQAIQTFIEKQF